MAARTMPFADRSDAGQRLGEHLASLGLDRPVVVGLARGGVVVAAAVAGALRAPLEILVVRKLGYPLQPELGVGALSEGGTCVVNHRLVTRLGMTPDELDDVVRFETDELARRVVHYRGGRPMISVAGRTVVVVDDGLATGFSARAALSAVRQAGAGRVVLAVPVGAAEALDALLDAADDVVSLEVPLDLFAIGEWYEDFHQVRDEDVEALLADGARPDMVGQPPSTRPVLIPTFDGHRLPGVLTVPPRASGVVVFAHGSGSSRHSPRNLEVARRLEHLGLATVLFDLLREDETANASDPRALAFDIDLLAGRLVDAARWVDEQSPASGLPLGLFGASTGAAAAMVAAAELGSVVRAVVSRGGRPDLAAGHLAEVHCPTLLVVGECDASVLELNRTAARQLPGEHQLLVVPGASHLFEEPGALDVVADSAGQWFLSAFGYASVPR